jgi:hypothetical protein
MTSRARLSFRLVAAALVATACSTAPSPPTRSDPQGAMPADARVAYLHHSTGGNVWAAGVPQAIQAWNASNGKSYAITEITYPSTAGGYPWANYPYDYWNLWVNHRGASRDRGELNLDDLAAYDVIVWKHCFPVSAIGPDGTAPSVASPEQTRANYELQYAALKARMRELPGKRFVVWTGAALVGGATDPASAERARQFFGWVKDTWDEPGDNVYVWDFHQLETGGGLYLLPGNAASTTDSHPNATFSAAVAPLVARRIVDVIEGRGDTGSLTGE